MMVKLDGVWAQAPLSSETGRVDKAVSAEEARDDFVGEAGEAGEGGGKALGWLRVETISAHSSSFRSSQSQVSSKDKVQVGSCREPKRLE